MGEIVSLSHRGLQLRLCIVVAFFLALTSQFRATSAQDEAPAISKPGSSFNEISATGPSEIGSGRIQVTLSWNNKDDVDLWVLEPNTTKIYYGNRGPTASGGRLDHDAYAACTNAPPAIENIYWPSTANPSPGVYHAVVDLFRDCEAGAAQWTLTVTVDGQLKISQSGTGTHVDVPFTVGPQIEIMNVETAQATQDEAGSVSLVAGKWTLMRVYLNCTLPCPPDGVTGIFGTIEGPNGANVTSSLNQYQMTITRSDNWTQLRSSLDKTLNFTIPPELTRSGVINNLTLKIYAAVGTASQLILTQPVALPPFYTTKQPDLLFVPITHRDTLPEGNIGSAWTWMRDAYPVTGVKYTAYGQPFISEKDLNNRAAKLELIDRLSRLEGANKHDFVVGWLPGWASSFFDGVMIKGTNVVLVLAKKPQQLLTTLAHEIGHVYGLEHTALNCNPTINAYGYQRSSTGGWNLFAPGDKVDFMSDTTCANGWVAPATYYELFVKLMSQSQQPVNAQSIQPYYLITGIISTDNTVALDPLLVVNTDNPRLPPPGSGYCAEILDASSAVLSSHCFDLSFTDVETGEVSDMDILRVMLPFNNAAKSIRIRKGAQTIATRVFSANAPTVQVTYPNGGEVWAANHAYTISWTGSDRDGDTLTYNVFHTANGIDWTPLALDLTQTSYTVNTASLPGGNNARIRVVASDGANNGEDSSDAVFSVPNQGPALSIILPSSAITITQGSPLGLEAYAMDAEDGLLSGNSLSWSSSINGVLGAGERLLVSSLSLGTHAITVTATDGSGKRSTAAVQVKVIANTKPTAAPVLLTLTNNLLTNSSTLNFTWQPVTNAGSYEIELDLNPGFTNPQREFIVNATSYTTSIIVNGNYNWRVRAYNRVGSGPWSQVRHFKLDTVGPNTPVMSSPPCNLTTTEDTPTFKWQSISDAMGYELLLDTVNPPITTYAFPNNTTFTAPAPLIVATYYWRLRALDEIGNASNWTTLCVLTKRSEAATSPWVHFYRTPTPTLTWNRIDWAKAYEIEVAHDQGFTDIVFNTTITDPSIQRVTTSALRDGSYYWHVRARQADNTWGAWNEPELFGIDTP